ncbi:MAG: 3-deoxy-manno-octulosonate cytidylyltransferase [Pseudomonadota bacterium]
MTEFHVVIPARFGSTRLPGKPLLEIGGRAMVFHVIDRSRQSGAASVTVATDDERIFNAVEEYGGHVVMTDVAHQSGTDRVAQVCRQSQFSEDSVVVNVQGDEPEMPPELIRQVADALHNRPDCLMSTACTSLAGDDDCDDPNVVKVVRDIHLNALYFSRRSIPWNDQKSDSGLYRHIGIYGYRNSFLQNFSALEPCQIEQFERLEQLRALYHGYRITCVDAVRVPPPGVDSQADLDATRDRMRPAD